MTVHRPAAIAIAFAALLPLPGLHRMAAAAEPVPSGQNAIVAIDQRTGGPGTVLTITGTCAFPGQPADDVLVRVFRTSPKGSGPYAFVEHLIRPDRRQRIRDVVTLPPDVRNGEYFAEIACFALDQGLGQAQTPFTVTGGIDCPCAPSTTSTTAPTTTTASGIATTEPPHTNPTLRARPRPPSPPTDPTPPAQAATPTAANPDFTG